MRQRSYRRITRFLFLLLFLVFFLLFLLLSGRDLFGSKGGGRGNRTRDMGTIVLSEVRSGGFIVDDFPLPAATLLEQEDFNENTLTCQAVLHNEGAETIRVVMNIYGTDLHSDQPSNPGLCGGFYYSAAGDNSLATTDYRSFLTDAASTLQVYPHSQKNLELHVETARYPLEFSLAPGETRNLTLFFWADAQALPLLTNLERDAYSVTVKLTARGI